MFAVVSANSSEKRDKMRVGVIGVGYWGKKHVEEYLSLGCTVYAADQNEQNLNFLKKKYSENLFCTTDYANLLKNDKIKAISICTPNATHFKIAKDCLNAKKNILIEKPVARNIPECEELEQLSKENGLVVYVGHIFRFNNAIRKTKELIENGTFGKLWLVDLWWTNLEKVFNDRDVIEDIAPHPVDILDHLFKKTPTEIFCSGTKVRSSKNLEHVNITCKISGVPCNMALSWITPEKRRILRIVGSDSTIEVECVKQIIKISRREKTSILHSTPNNTIRDELSNFLESVEKKAPIMAGLKEGSQTICFIDKCRRSYLEGKVIR